jgi:tungstate transport system substrate-binding protein
VKRTLLSVVLLISVVFVLCGASHSAQRLRLASTTSTEDSGFFDYILPIFEKKTGMSVHVIALGTGAALELGKRGDADAVLVHAKDLELQAVREGHFVDRREVMFNSFLMVGPKDDPAGVGKAKTAADAIRKIFHANRAFVSRGDNSGTHTKEKGLWKSAANDPSELKDKYVEAGQGMAKTLRIASEKGAYTLTDSSTYLSMRDESGAESPLRGRPGAHEPVRRDGREPRETRPCQLQVGEGLHRLARVGRRAVGDS